jgi:hypothetical protein
VKKATTEKKEKHEKKREKAKSPTDGGRDAMNILFFGRRFTYFRNFDTVLRELASRGHLIHLAVDTRDRGGPAARRGTHRRVSEQHHVGLLRRPHR